LHLGEFDDGWVYLLKLRWDARAISWNQYAKEMNSYANAQLN